LSRRPRSRWLKPSPRHPCCHHWRHLAPDTIDSPKCLEFERIRFSIVLAWKIRVKIVLFHLKIKPWIVNSFWRYSKLWKNFHKVVCVGSSTYTKLLNSDWLC
jgi:hypothetical protein